MKDPNRLKRTNSKGETTLTGLFHIHEAVNEINKPLTGSPESRRGLKHAVGPIDGR